MIICICNAVSGEPYDNASIHANKRLAASYKAVYYEYCIQQYSAVCSSMQQYAAVFSSIQQYSAV
jgi:hypothetical protein